MGIRELMADFGFWRRRRLERSRPRLKTGGDEGAMSSNDREKPLQAERMGSAVVDAYLKAIRRPKRRGRPVSVSELEARRRRALSEAESSEGIARLKNLQTVADLNDRIDAATNGGEPDLEALEDAFVDVAFRYSEKHGIAYSTWREAGVPAAALRRAGIRQTRRRTSS
jgi:hypothetical protein